MFIRSERLFLRPGWPEDWQELLAGIADEAVVKNLAQAPWPYTADDARDFLRQPQDPRCPHFFVTLPTSSAPAEIIGGVALMPGESEAELGYWIAQEHWGQGYATEATRAVLGLARTLGHRRVSAGPFTDNPASARVLRKAGFRPTGEMRACFSRARGKTVPAAIHAIDLGEPGSCDGGDDGVPAMRAA